MGDQEDDLPHPGTHSGRPASFVLLSVAMRSLPLGTAYTVWTGIGAAGAFVIGIVFLGEQLSPVRACAALLIVGGLLLMKLAAH